MTLWILLPLLAVAQTSPTLTLLRLWQIKEWRTDRLFEHASREGLLKPFFGWLRPLIALAWILSSIALFMVRGFTPLLLAELSVFLLLVFAALTCAQIGFRKQPKPAWTSKAIAMASTSLLLPLLLTIGMRMEWPDSVFATLVTALFPLATPGFIILAWLLLKPIDQWLKYRIISRAIAARKAHPNLTVIGITGSVGKTTTKELLAHILKPLQAIATPAHLNTDIGVARWITNLLRTMPLNESRIIIVEMGAYRAGEITLLTRITEPQIGIVTYIGSQHLSLFGSREAIREAKGELLRALAQNGHAFLNSDNDSYATLRAMCRCPVTSVGTDQRADLTAFDVEETKGGLRFRTLDTVFSVPIAGTHTMTSILLAIAVARHLGITTKDIATSIQSFRPLKHTFELTTLQGVTVLDDTYNASSTSFRAAITWAREQAAPHKTLLTDGIIELGQEEEMIHRALAENASKVFDEAYIVSPHFLEYFHKGGFGNRAKLADEASPLREGDLLVCVGRLPRTTIDRFLPPRR
jgi:UDP-N-acetylmuramoyl-tripeptide--D-alanyl-D-alanine ligase